ncbi:MAG: hypothetical protein ACREXP_17080, partial [Steroidobacteraceae bacterium]
MQTRVLGALIACATISCVQGVMAAPAESDRAAGGGTDEPMRARALEEIIVTAQKRSQNVRDVPISITALTADEIERRGLFDAADYLRG